MGPKFYGTPESHNKIISIRFNRISRTRKFNVTLHKGGRGGGKNELSSILFVIQDLLTALIWLIVSPRAPLSLLSLVSRVSRIQKATLLI